MKKIKKQIVTKLLMITFMILSFEFIAKPVISFKSIAFNLFVLILLTVTPIPEVIIWFKTKKANKKREKEDFELGYTEKSDIKYLYLASVAIIGLIMLFYIFAGSWKLPFTNRKADFHNLLEYEESSVFEENFEEQKQEAIILLDKDEALRVAKTFVPDGGLYTIDRSNATLNQVEEDGQTKFYWNFTLRQEKFLKMLFNNNVPGFIKVDATKIESGEFVEQEMKYVRSDILGQSLERQLRIKSGKRNVFFTDFSFELDDNNKGFWVATKYKYNYGISVKEILGISILDPMTGDVEEYKVDGVPKWVDRVFPEKEFHNLTEKWARNDLSYGSGGSRAVNETNYYIKDNKINFYAEITSSGDDERLLGFMLFSPRTGEANFFELDGKLSDRVWQDMNGAIEKPQYEPEKLRVVNVANIPTYFSKVKAEKSIVGYTYGSVKQGTTAVAWGETIEEAKTNYLNRYFNEHVESGDINSSLKTNELTGFISRVGFLESDKFIFKLENKEEIFKISSIKFPHIALTREGDLVKIKYFGEEDKSQLQNVKEFENKNLN